MKINLPRSLVIVLLLLVATTVIAAASLPGWCSYCLEPFEENELINILPDFAVVHDHCYQDYLDYVYGGTPPVPWGPNYDPVDVPWGGK